MQCKVILKSNENTMCYWKRSKVRGLVIQREGTSTKCIFGAPQEPFEISFFRLKIICLVKMGVNEILKIRRPSIEVLT